MSKVLITGADGFIGSHLLELLVERGYDVRAFCFYNSFGSLGWLDSIDKQIIDNIEVILGDIRDPFAVNKAVSGCEYVFHLAALIGIPYSYQAPSSYVDTNIHGTLNVVQASRDNNVERIIHTSTSETYGSAKFVPITEEHPLVGQSPYAASKIGADQIALSYWRSFRTPISVIRPFNTYGPRQSNRAVIPTIITQIASGKEKINLGLLTTTRDFSFVTDTCKAFLSIAESEETIGRVINSSSNFEISISETANLISKIMKKNIEIINDSKRKRPDFSEVNRLYGDNTLIKKLTNWQPEYEGLIGFKRGLSKTIDWFSNENNLLNYKNEKYNI